MDLKWFVSRTQAPCLCVGYGRLMRVCVLACFTMLRSVDITSAARASGSLDPGALHGDDALGDGEFEVCAGLAVTRAVHVRRQLNLPSGSGAPGSKAVAYRSARRRALGVRRVGSSRYRMAVCTGLEEHCARGDV